jgi:hypothetical protein
MIGFSRLETATYRARFSSGLLELFAGVALTTMGTLWLVGIAGIAGIVPALLIPLWAPFSERLVERRAGYARPV